jgi:hypothetical protein
VVISPAQSEQLGPPIALNAGAKQCLVPLLKAAPQPRRLTTQAPKAAVISIRQSAERDPPDAGSVLERLTPLPGGYRSGVGFHVGSLLRRNRDDVGLVRGEVLRPLPGTKLV